MKNLLKQTINTLLFAIILLLTSCKKDKVVQRESFQTTLTTWYRVSPTTPSTLFVNNASYVSLANLIVGGEGNTTNMGTVKTYANTISYSSTANGIPLGAIGAPVKEIPPIKF